MMNERVMAYVPRMEDVFRTFLPPKPRQHEAPFMYDMRVESERSRHVSILFGGTVLLMSQYLLNPEQTANEMMENFNILHINALMGAPVDVWSDNHRKHTQDEVDEIIRNIPKENSDFFERTRMSRESALSFYTDGRDRTALPESAVKELAQDIIDGRVASPNVAYNGPVMHNDQPAMNNDQPVIDDGGYYIDGGEPMSLEDMESIPPVEDDMGMGMPGTPFLLNPALGGNIENERVSSDQDIDDRTVLEQEAPSSMESTPVETEMTLPLEESAPPVTSSVGASEASSSLEESAPPVTSPPRPEAPESIPFDGLRISALPNRIMPQGEERTMRSTIDPIAGYVSYSNRLREEANKSGSSLSDLARLYNQRLNNAEYLEHYDSYSDLMMKRPEYIHQLATDIRGRDTIRNVRLNADAISAVDLEINKYLKLDTPAASTMEQLERSATAFRLMLSGSVDKDSLPMVVGAMAGHGQHLMESPQQLVALSLDSSKSQLLDLAVSQRYVDGMQDISSELDDRPRAKQYLAMVQEQLSKDYILTGPKRSDREDVFIKMQANPKDSLSLGRLVSVLPKDEQDRILNVMSEDAIATRDRHPNMHYADTLNKGTYQDRDEVIERFHKVANNYSPSSIKDTADLFIVCLKEQDAVGADSAKGQEWGSMVHDQIKILKRLGEEEGLKDSDILSKVLASADADGFSRPKALSTFRLGLDVLARDNAVSYDPETGDRIDSRDEGFAQRTPSLWRDSAVGPQFCEISKGEDEDITFGAYKVDAIEDQATVELSADDVFWQRTRDTYVQENERGLFYRDGIILNEEDGFTASKMVDPFLGIDGQRVRDVLRDKYAPAFALPLNNFGIKGVGNVGAGIRGLMETPEGRQRVCDIMEGTRNMRDSIIGGRSVRNLSEVDLLRHDQLEMGYRSLLAAVGHGRGRHKEFDGLDAHVTPFKSDQGAKVMKLNERYVHAVQLSRDTQKATLKPPGAIEKGLTAALKWKALHIFAGR